MTIKVIAIFLAGLVFLLIGILKSKNNKWTKISTFVPIFIGLLLIYITTVGPLSESKRHIEVITTIDSTSVKSIILQPTQNNIDENISLFTTDTLIIDRKIINKICKELHFATIEGEGYLKNPDKVCRVEIHFVDNTTVSFGVRKLEESTCINLSSNGETGWHYANLRADEFGNTLNSFAN